MPTTAEIIEAAAKDAEGTDIDSPDVDTDDTSTESVDTMEEVVHEDAAEGSPAKDESFTVDATTKDAPKPGDTEDVKTKELDALSRELEGLGIKPPKEGERENRIPRSRMVKIFGNAKKKWVAEHAAELKTRDDKIAGDTKRQANYDNADRLIATDPDRYLQMLAALHPVYKQYLGGKQVPEVAKPATPVVSALGPRPKPDITYTPEQGGGIGYSPEQHEKLLDWIAANAKAEAITEAEARFTKRFGSIEKTWQAQEARQQLQPTINAQISRASKLYGKLFDDDYALGSNPATQDKSEILRALKANSDMPFDAVVASVLLPKIQTDENAKRSAIIKELNARKPAAAKAAPAAIRTGAVDPNAPKTTEEIVKEALARAR